MRKKLIVLVLLVLSCAVLCSCADSSGTEETGRDAANEIVVGIAQDLDESLDPHLAVAAGTKEIMFNVFEGLLKPNSAGELVEALCESYEVSEDRLSYTFYICQGVKFHNGQEMTADDVVYSIERCADASGGTPLVAGFEIIEKVEKTDDRTVVITLSEPSNEFISYMTTAIIPADYSDEATAPVGTGPFKFVSRSAQESIVFERFDDYWGDGAYLDKITFKIIENTDSMMMSLQSGSIDFCAHLESSQTEQLSDDFYVSEATMNLVQALYLNNAAEPFDNELVRQALCYAVDKQEIIDMAFDGYGVKIGSSMYPAFGKYFDDSLTDYYTYDPEKAMELLSDAGYPDGFSMTITVPSNYQPHISTAEVIVEQLKKAGIDAKLEFVEWDSWVSDVYTNRQFQSTVVGVDASNMTARALLERFVSDYGKNFINYNNPEYDELFSRAISCYDDEEQTAIYKDMERILTETAANVYIQDLADLVAIKNGIEGFEPYPIYVLDFSTVHYAE